MVIKKKTTTKKGKTERQTKICYKKPDDDRSTDEAVKICIKKKKKVLLNHKTLSKSV